MSKKQVYVTLCRFLGGGTVEAGSPIELTPAQAAHPLYRNRVRLRDAVEPELTPSLDEKGEEQATEDSPPVGDGSAKPWNLG